MSGGDSLLVYTLPHVACLFVSFELYMRSLKLSPRGHRAIHNQTGPTGIPRGSLVVLRSSTAVLDSYSNILYTEIVGSSKMFYLDREE